jgi:dTMP kinase
MTAETIVLEGSDGAGKETQTKKLLEFLIVQGKKVASVSFPRYRDTVGGKLLFEAFKVPERAAHYNWANVNPQVASMLYAMDRLESKQYLEDLIATHDVVIFDRYIDSNLLHQGGKFKTEQEMLEFAQWVYTIEHTILQLPVPRHHVYLHIPFWLSMARAKRRAEEKGEQPDALEANREYVQNGHRAGEFYASRYGWKIISGLEGTRELSPNEVHTKVLVALGFTKS